MFKNSVTDILKNHDFRQIELEFRIGVQQQYKFHPDIPKQEWANAIKKIETTTPVFQNTETIEFYTPSKPDESSRYVVNQLRTETYWEHKKKISNDTKTFEKFSVRSSLAMERKESGIGPSKVTLQRKKSRTSFLKGPWKIDFTKVESIPSEDKDSEETYEIEVELYDLCYFFEKEIDIIIGEGFHICKNIL